DRGSVSGFLMPEFGSYWGFRADGGLTASKIGITDAGGLIAATDVEGALQELAASPGGGSGRPPFMVVASNDAPTAMKSAADY
ncbi:hypothetical protein, partial [Streptococcus pseudopneumoniae]|uniref:hypothetical protein n=1 Tax=Streptococcus pseudopneumoniae TaxID=257758 RepID=UPI0019D520FF